MRCRGMVRLYPGSSSVLGRSTGSWRLLTTCRNKAPMPSSFPTGRLLHPAAVRGFTRPPFARLDDSPSMSEHMFDDRMRPRPPLRAAERGRRARAPPAAGGARARAGARAGGRRGLGRRRGVRDPSRECASARRWRAAPSWSSSRPTRIAPSRPGTRCCRGSRGSGPRWSPSGPGRRSSPRRGCEDCGAVGSRTSWRTRGAPSRSRRVSAPARHGSAPTRRRAGRGRAAGARARGGPRAGCRQTPRS